MVFGGEGAQVKCWSRGKEEELGGASWNVLRTFPCIDDLRMFESLGGARVLGGARSSCSS